MAVFSDDALKAMLSAATPITEVSVAAGVSPAGLAQVVIRDVAGRVLAVYHVALDDVMLPAAEVTPCHTVGP